MPRSGRIVSESATRKSVGTSRPQSKLSARCNGSAGSVVHPPAGASGNAARTRRSLPATMSVVQPPKLCPLIPIRSGSIAGTPSTPATMRSITKLTSPGRAGMMSDRNATGSGGGPPICACIIIWTVSKMVLPVWSIAATT